jgi:WD40 repeat protein
MTSSYDRTARLYDAFAGHCKTRLVGHKEAVNSVVLSANGAQVGTASMDRTAKLWDASSGECLQTFRHRAPVFSIDFVVDGALSFIPGNAAVFTHADDGGGRLFDVDSGDVIRTISFRPQGSKHHFASLCDGTRKVVATMANHRAFVPGAGYVDVEGNFLAKLFDLDSGQCQVCFRGHTNDVLSLDVSCSGEMIATASADASARIFSIADGTCLQTLMGHAGPVASAKFSGDEMRIVTASDDYTSRVFSVASGACEHVFELRSFVNVAMFSPDSGKVLVLSGFQYSTLFDASSGERELCWEGHHVRLQFCPR